MQFLIHAYDATDGKALERRLAVREKHFEKVRELKAKGNAHFGGAILNEAGKMIGSIMVVEFPSQKELDEWLKVEPYVIGKVWETIEIKPFKIPPHFWNN